MKYIALAILAAALLAGCGTPEAASPAQLPQPSPSITAAPEPNTTPTLSPTRTAIPAECKIVQLTPQPNSVPPWPGPGETIISADGWQRVVCPTTTPTTAPAATAAQAAPATSAPLGGGRPCPDRFAQGEGAPTPAERNDTGTDPAPCLPAARLDPSAPPAPVCPPIDDHPPPLQRPTSVGRPAGCATTTPNTRTGASGSTPTPIQGQRMIGLPSQGQTIELQVGETLELRLTGEMEWTVRVGDAQVIERMDGQLVKGSQGVFRALAPGTSALEADGEPLCRRATPACASPSFHYSVTIAVHS